MLANKVKFTCHCYCFFCIIIFSISILISTSLSAQDLSFLSKIADVSYVSLTGCDFLDDSEDMQSQMGIIGNYRKSKLTTYINRKNIYIQVDNNQKYDRFLKFNKQGVFIDSCTLYNPKTDKSLGRYFDVKGKKIYFGTHFLSSAIYNTDLNPIFIPTVESGSQIDKNYGTTNIFTLGKRRILSFSRNNTIIRDAKDLTIIDTVNLHINRGFSYLNLPIVRSSHRKIIVGSGTLDSINVINRRAKISSLSLNCSMPETDMSNLYVYPILDSRKYMLLDICRKLGENELFKRESIYNRYIYIKREKKIYKLDSIYKQDISAQMMLLNNAYAINDYNVTKKCALAVQIYSRDFLLEHINELPEELVTLTSNLDSGDAVLLLIKFE
ncbi:MAG: hypothetical protein R3Y50_09925 [Rikenellaceae bacterium]